MNASSPHVPSHFLDTPAREASDPPEEALHRERNPDQRPPLPAAHQTELEVTGERDGGFYSVRVSSVDNWYKSVLVQEEFCFPVECLSLTVEEVMHIRQVLVKAELEKFQQYKDVYNAMKKGKVTPHGLAAASDTFAFDMNIRLLSCSFVQLCFCCRTKRFSLFTWSYICQFCKK